MPCFLGGPADGRLRADVGVWPECFVGWLAHLIHTTCRHSRARCRLQNAHWPSGLPGGDRSCSPPSWPPPSSPCHAPGTPAGCLRQSAPSRLHCVGGGGRSHQRLHASRGNCIDRDTDDLRFYPVVPSLPKYAARLPDCDLPPSSLRTFRWLPHSEP